MDYKEYWEQIDEKRDELYGLLNSYWHDYSNIGTWQFWIVISFLVIPLVLLIFTVDQKRIFEVFFFGYTVHVLWTYAGIVVENSNYFIHTYFLSPYLPFSLSMNVSAIPVGFLLLYQYCTKNNKNFYLYAIVASAFYAFGIATIEEKLGLIQFKKGMNKFHLFIIDIIIVYFAYWFTQLLLKIRNS